MKGIIEALGITPGPWWSESDYIAAKIEGKRPNGEVIGHMTTSINKLLSRKQRALNARCAAAAPEMLEALIEDSIAFDRAVEAEPVLRETKTYKVFEKRVSIIEKASGETFEKVKALRNETII